MTRSAPAVSLRGLQPDDRLRLLTWRNDAEIRRWMYTDHWISHEEHAAWFDFALVDPSRRYWVVESDSEPVGLANLYALDPKNRRASWAYYLGDPQARGKGVGAMVEYAVIEAAFEGHGLHKLWCEVLADNRGVLRLHESFGFRREAVLREHLWKDAHWTDVIGLGLLKADWDAARDGCRARLEARGFDLSGLKAAA